MKKRKPTGYEIGFTYGIRESESGEGWFGTGGEKSFAVSMRQAQSIISARLKRSMHTDSGRPDHQFTIKPVYGPFAVGGVPA